jgi:hypothetical protein
MAPPSAPDFSAHLIDEGHEIRERFVAHGPIRPMCSKRQERAIEIAVDRPVDHPPACDGLRRRAGHGAVPQFIKILEAGSRAGEIAFVAEYVAQLWRAFARAAAESAGFEAPTMSAGAGPFTNQSIPCTRPPKRPADGPPCPPATRRSVSSPCSLDPAVTARVPPKRPAWEGVNTIHDSHSAVVARRRDDERMVSLIVMIFKLNYQSIGSDGVEIFQSLLESENLKLVLACAEKGWAVSGDLELAVFG